MTLALIIVSAGLILGWHTDSAVRGVEIQVPPNWVISHSTDYDVSRNTSSLEFLSAGFYDIGSILFSKSSPMPKYAYEASIKYVTTRLKAPSTAKFSSFNDSRLAPFQNGWIVCGTVDSQNEFGAYLRENFEVYVQPKSGNVDWTIKGCLFLDADGKDLDTSSAP